MRPGLLQAVLEGGKQPIEANFFDTSTTPDGVAFGSAAFIVLGTQFKTSVAGRVLGVGYFKIAGNSACTVKLWDAAGNLLASKDNTTETASGWQRQDFDEPVAIDGNTRYIVTYEPTSGTIDWYYNNGYFTADVVVGVLTGYATGSVSPGNGVYKSTSTGFPDASSDDCYFCDPFFEYTT